MTAAVYILASLVTVMAATWVTGLAADIHPMTRYQSIIRLQLGAIAVGLWLAGGLCLWLAVEGWVG